MGNVHIFVRKSRHADALAACPFFTVRVTDERAVGLGLRFKLDDVRELRDETQEAWKAAHKTEVSFCASARFGVGIVSERVESASSGLLGQGIRVERTERNRSDRLFSQRRRLES